MPGAGSQRTERRCIRCQVIRRRLLRRRSERHQLVVPDVILAHCASVTNFGADRPNIGTVCLAPICEAARRSNSVNLRTNIFMSTRRTFLMQSISGLTAAASIPIDQAAALSGDAGDFKAQGKVKAVASADLTRVSLGDEYGRSADRITLKIGAPLLRDPIWYYSNWSAYDELSDDVELTEELAMRQLGELARLRRLGVKLDYYLMDAFWYAPDGAYRTWRKPHWPNGPDRWIAACQQIGVKPGLWFSANVVGKDLKIELAPQWRSSLGKSTSSTEQSLSFSEGGFLNDFMDVLQYWYNRGIQMIKLDFADFSATGPKARENQSKAEVYERNKTALRNALVTFRRKNPEVVFLAYNFFLDFPYEPKATDNPAALFRSSSVDLRWLEVFDSLFSGDARPADIPQVNFWRSIDLFTDQQVRFYEKKFVPLDRIDSAGFMSGDTNTSFRRKAHAWKGMLILNAARGGWVNTFYGSLQYLDDENARWFARVQKIYLPLQAEGRTKTFGEDPDEVQAYGFGSVDATGSIYTVVNPAQEIVTVSLPTLSSAQTPLQSGRVIFSDAGFVPKLGDSVVTLGPGQMASIGFGRYSAPEYDLGVQEDVSIPRDIRPIAADFVRNPPNAIEATIAVPTTGDIRIVFQQRDQAGNPLTTKTNETSKTSFGKLLKIWAEQGGNRVTVEMDYDRYLWSGLSWASGEIRGESLKRGQPITIHCSTVEEGPVSLKGDLYVVEY